MAFVILDVGMGGLVIFLGGVALVVFIVLAIIITVTSIRIIKRRIRENESVERESNEDFLKRLSQVDSVVESKGTEEEAVKEDEV